MFVILGEVFGHGLPAVAPTSRNYNEMRERLRQRLSKRKAQSGGCENSHNGYVAAAAAAAAAAVPQAIAKKPDNPTVEDKRDLEELISFINGTGASKKEGKKKQKKKKEKPQKKEVISHVELHVEQKLSSTDKNNKENSQPKPPSTPTPKANGHVCPGNSRSSTPETTSAPKESVRKSPQPAKNQKPSEVDKIASNSVANLDKPSHVEKLPSPSRDHQSRLARNKEAAKLAKSLRTKKKASEALSPGKWQLCARSGWFY